MSERQRRADAGTVRATKRDVEALSWVVEMYGMPYDLLQRLTGTSDSALRQMVWRWRRGGWVETGQIGAGPSWVWATKAGIEAFGRHPYEAHRPSAAKVPHHRAVIAVRMQVEANSAQQGTRVAWTGERELRYELGRRLGSEAARVHLVDAVQEQDTSAGRQRAGVEVELSPKPVDVLKSNMLAGLDRKTGFQQVIWYVTDRTRSLVERARESMGQATHSVIVRELPEGGELE